MDQNGRAEPPVPPREVVAAGVILADLRVADEAVLAAITECSSIAGRPWDGWRKSMIEARHAIESVVNRMEGWQ